jgi:valyl-tRNA synthetase
VDVEKELGRLARKLKAVDRDIVRLQGRLSSGRFLEKAPPEVVRKTRESLNELLELREKLNRTVAELERLKG